MEEFKNINAYINKKGNKYVVFKTEEGKTYVVNEGLLQYVLKTAKEPKPKTED